MHRLLQGRPAARVTTCFAVSADPASRATSSSTIARGTSISTRTSLATVPSVRANVSQCATGPSVCATDIASDAAAATGTTVAAAGHAWRHNDVRALFHGARGRRLC